MPKPLEIRLLVWGNNPVLVKEIKGQESDLGDRPQLEEKEVEKLENRARIKRQARRMHQYANTVEVDTSLLGVLRNRAICEVRRMLL